MHSHASMLDELNGIARGAVHVRLDEEQLTRVTEAMSHGFQVGYPEVYLASPRLEPADRLQYYLIAGTQNFLIWQQDSAGRAVPWHLHIDGELHYGAPAIYACHKRALDRGMQILDPYYLASMTLADMESFYRDDRMGDVTLQLVPERLAKFHEIGAVLQRRYGGSFMTLMEKAEGFLFREDGQGIVQQLVREFPICYGDWPFCKLAMVTLGNLYNEQDELFPRASRARDLLRLRDPGSLEVGADYYRPFFFYRVGMLRLSPALRRHLLDQELIERDSPMERELRAWTILAARGLAGRLGLTPHDLARATWAMGFLSCRLCRIGVGEDELPCVYRAFCRSYNQEPDLMRGFWPLVLTSRY